jgi:hypothetical protein
VLEGKRDEVNERERHSRRGGEVQVGRRINRKRELGV